MSNNSHESYLRPFFETMNNEFHNQWCVLHSYETLPFFSSSDVDMAFSSTNVLKLEKLIVDLGKTNGWSIYQKLWYDVQFCLYYVLKKDNEDIFLALDFLIDPKGIGKYGFSTSVLTHNCNQHNIIIPIPNNEIACCYKLVKRIVKKRLLDKDDTYIKNHYALSDSKVIAKVLSQHFNKESVSLLLRYLNGTKDYLTETEISQLNHIRIKHISTSKRKMRFNFWNANRVLNRIFIPKGIIINIPNLEQKELEEFTNLLSTKVDILFRFVELNKTDSFLNNFKLIIGNTLIINPKKKYNPKKAIRLHWLYPRTASVPVHTELDLVLSINQMVDFYYQAILHNLQMRFQ